MKYTESFTTLWHQHIPGYEHAEDGIYGLCYGDGLCWHWRAEGKLTSGQTPTL